MKRLGWWLLGMAIVLPGCNPTSPSSSERIAAAPEIAAVAAPKQTENHLLTIYGYNYTNRYIDEFEVDGQSGGNVDPSSHTAGGGKGVCCMGWRDGTRLPQTVHVRWVAGGCKFLSPPNQYGERFEAVQHFFKEKDVVLTGPVPSDPGYFEVHFFPDERIDIAITTLPSTPRLQLDPARAVDPYSNKCKPES